MSLRLPAPQECSPGDMHFQMPLFEVKGKPERAEQARAFRVLDSPELRTEYVKYTERLIASLIEDRAEEVVFLDKSARPVAWLVRELWGKLGIDEEGNQVPAPNMRFANIDREQWGPVVGRSEDRERGMDLSRIHPGAIQSLRDTFQDHTETQGNATYFDDKRVVIVDEVKASGDTLNIAIGVFSRAFPDMASVKGAYWMTPESKSLGKGVRVNARLPVWYKDNDVHGRGVANRNQKVSESSVSSRQRTGALWLSTRFPYVDEKSSTLREEIRLLGEEIDSGIIPVIPSGHRTLEATEAILRDVNQLDIEEYKLLLSQSVKSGEPIWRVIYDYKLGRAMASHPAGKGH